MEVVVQALPVINAMGRQVMQTPEDVAQMLRLKAAGLGIKSIARKMGCSKNTVRRYLRGGGWVAYRRPERNSALRGLEPWLAERLQRHHGNADVVRQDLERKHSIAVSLRTVERAVAPFRRELRAAEVATIRFETAPGEQLQIDFGETGVAIAGERVRVHLFVATLGYSRRPYVAVLSHERQSAWWQGIEGAFHHFGGRPRELLIDNAKPLVDFHDAQTREVRFNERFRAFCRYWDVLPKACAPYRARTKGKDERGVGYVKRNAIAGHAFDSLAALEAHLAWWMREVADRRVHGTTGEMPIERFQAKEAAALRPLDGRTTFQPIRECVRRVHADACIELETNRYSVPWRLIGETVSVLVNEQVRILHAGQEVAVHTRLAGQRRASMHREHLLGIVGAEPRPQPNALNVPAKALPELLRSLHEYEALTGGAW
ncbi:MAG: IS21 family transposase [Betaproteobacteria bacterium]